MDYMTGERRADDKLRKQRDIQIHLLKPFVGHSNGLRGVTPHNHARVIF